jgi:formate hydrogenlyase subunit 3/multisubunit Na+/H+ antiporter MnhD subunit
MAWEMMALSSFFLVTFEDEKESTRQAGWIYLVASHIGTAFLLVLFILLGRANGSLDFDRFAASSGAGLLFVLALV